MPIFARLLIHSLSSALLVSLFTPLARADDIKIAAAASLQDALAAMNDDFTVELPGTKVRISPAASGTIHQQITQGAPIDIFLSAAAKPINGLERDKLLTPGTLKIFLSNDLVLIAPEASSLKTVFDLKDAKVKRIALGEPRVVPAGDYASQTLTSMKLFDSLTSKYIFAKDVRQVLSYVARGEVDAGFVYKSDLQSEAAKGVKLIEAVPNDRHEPIQYYMASIAASQQSDKTKKLMAYFEGPKAAVIWKKFGFRTPEAPSAAELNKTSSKHKEKEKEKEKGGASVPH